MSFKTTSFVAPHYPNTYMEQFCRALHPDLELGTVCVQWFRQATKYCTELLSNSIAPTSFFWTTVKNFIFPDRSTGLVSQKIPITIHPNRLSMQDCHSLFLDIVKDYVQRAPRYSAESTTNVMLWQVLYSFMGVMALGSVLLGIIFIYNKYWQTKQKIKTLENIFGPEKRMQAAAKRSLGMAKTELRNLRVKPVVQAEDILSPDGAGVMVLKVGTKYDLLDSVVEGRDHIIGKLHRLSEQSSKTQPDFKIESLNKAMKFLDTKHNKLHLLLVFEEDLPYEEKKLARKSTSPRVKSVSPPSTASFRKSCFSLNRNLPTRLEAGGVPQKTTVIGAGMSPSSPRLRTVTTPRSSGVASSSIPRNVSKRSPIAGKSKLN